MFLSNLLADPVRVIDQMECVYNILVSATLTKADPSLIFPIVPLGLRREAQQSSRFRL